MSGDGKEEHAGGGEGREVRGGAFACHRLNKYHYCQQWKGVVRAFLLGKIIPGCFSRYGGAQGVGSRRRTWHRLQVAYLQERASGSRKCERSDPVRTQSRDVLRVETDTSREGEHFTFRSLPSRQVAGGVIFRAFLARCMPQLRERQTETTP